MIVLGVVIAVLCFLWLCLLALLRAARERGIREASVPRKLPRVSSEVIVTFATELERIQSRGKMTQAGQDCVAELREEQPALFALLVEFLKQQEYDDPKAMTPAFIVYKLLRAQMEADVLDQSFNPPAKPH